MAQVTTDINLILNGIQQLLPSLSSVLKPGQLTQLQTWLVEAEKAAAAVASSNSPNATVGAQFVAAVQSILGVLSSLPIPPPYNLVPGAIAVLLPIVATIFGITVTVPAAAHAMAQRLNPAQARIILAQKY